MLREPEPVYQGKRLSVWLEAYQHAYTGTNWLGAVEAVRGTGTKGIPTFLRRLRAKDSGLTLAFLNVANKQHFVRINYTFAVQRNQQGYMDLKSWALQPKMRCPP